MLSAVLDCAILRQPCFASENRDHVIFMGLDVRLEVDRGILPVVGANASAVYVVRNGETVRLPINQGLPQFKTEPEPRVSRTMLTIDDLRGDRVFSRAYDPRARAMDQQMLMDSIASHRQELAMVELSNAIRNAEGVTRAVNAGQPVREETKAAVERGMDRAMQEINSAYSGTSSFDPMSNVANPDDSSPFDGFEVACRLSSPVEIENAYAVLRLVVRAPQSPGQPMAAVKFFPIRKITPRPQKFVFTQYGLPLGFTIDSHELHIYVNGAELATNLSNNRVDVTAQEAHQVLLLRHLAENRTASLPIQALPELASPDLRQLIPPGQLGRTVNLDVDAEGRVTAVRLTPAETPENDPPIEAALKQTLFLPALLNGEAVASTGSFALSELTP